MMHLDANQSGSWRRCLDFSEQDIDRVDAAAVALARAAGNVKLRVRDNDGDVIAYWDEQRGWREAAPTASPRFRRTVQALVQATGDAP